MTKLLEHFKRMQATCCDYLTPDGGEEYGATTMGEYRDGAFIADIIEYLDGPEQREAIREDALQELSDLGQLIDGDGISAAINQLCKEVHAANVAVGWWTDHKTGESILETRNVPEMLMLIVSEIAEGMEGYRKDLMDDKLPHRKMLEVELADAVIRIADLCGARGYDLGGAIAEKRAYNANRADHKLENRIKPGGKAF
jgi:hypothetical protein